MNFTVQQMLRGLKICVTGGTCRDCPYSKTPQYKSRNCSYELYRDIKKKLCEKHITQMVVQLTELDKNGKN